MENEAGALSRVAGLFSARGYNIESLAVVPTEDPSLSRMTLVTRGTDEIIEQITKQLNKLIDVVKLMDMTEGPHIEREMMLVKVQAQGEQRNELKRVSDIFRGRIIDVTDENYTIELTGAGDKLDAFLQALDKSVIIEVTEWGVRAIVLDETGESSGHQGWLEHDSRYLHAPFGWWQCAACSKHRMKAEFTNAQLKKKATARCKRCTGSDTTSRRGAIRPHECAECKWIKPKESFTQSQLKKGAAAKCVACADGQGNVTNYREASILNWLEQAYSDNYFDREARWAASYYGEDPVPDENEEEAGDGYETKEAETGARVPL